MAKGSFNLPSGSGGGGASDNKVKYNADDSASGYLSEKTVAGNLIELSEGTDGDVDKLKIAATAYAMTTDTEQTVTGTKTFDSTRIAVKGSSTGSTAIASANDGADNFTATIQKKSGTVAYTDDIPADIGDLSDTGGLLFSGDYDDLDNKPTIPAEGANTSLSNLASVAINTSLISNTDSTDDLGSSDKYWANTYSNKVLVSDKIGIGTSSPDFLIHARIDGNSAVSLLETYSDTLGHRPIFFMKRARGTASSPTAVLNGNDMGGITLQGYDGTSFTTQGQVSFKAVGDWTSGSKGMRFFFEGTPEGSTTKAEWLSSLNGNIGIGQTTPTAILHIKAGTATSGTAPIKLTSGTNLTTAETGAVEYDGTSLYFTRTGTTRERIATVVTKTTAGDGTGAEGLFQINTNDNTFKIYAEGAWRQLATW